MFVTYSISGNVKADGANLAGATVSLNGSATRATTTDASGNYVFSAVNAGGNYTVTASKAGFVFNPSSQIISNLQTSQTLNFQNGMPLCTPPSADQVSWYRGEGDTNDSSGNNNNGNFFNGSYSVGKVGQAMNFDGATNYVSVADSPTNSITGQITVAAWIKSSTTNYQTILSKYDASVSNGRSFYFFISAGKLGLEVVQDNTTARQFVSTNAVVTANAYQHVAATYNPATQAMGLFLNGASVPLTVVDAGIVTAIQDSSSVVKLGAFTNGAGQNTAFFGGQIDDAQMFGRVLSAAEILSIADSGSAGVCYTNIAPTPSGGNVTSAPTTGVSLNFSNVASGGSTVAIPVPAAQLPALPGGFTLSSGGPIYDIRTSASYTGNLAITFDIPNVDNANTCSTLRILHYENGAWTSQGNVAPTYNAATMVCTVVQSVTSLSPFIVAKSVPTAAQVSVGGRVTTGKNRGIGSVRVTMTGSDGNARTAVTNSFGYYRFAGVAAGDTYTFSVSGKKYGFSNAAQVRSITGETDDINFVAD